MNIIRVALADDSPFIRKAVARLLSEEMDMILVGSAASGEDLLENLDFWEPDAIVLDLSMPGMNGLDVLDVIMRQRPTPVIILSTHSRRGAPLTLEALNRGAVDFIDKQEYSLIDFERLRHILISKLRGVRGHLPKRAEEPAPPVHPPASPAGPETSGIRAILIGASTGGPPAIERTLHDLGEVAVPILIAQHMPAGFTRAFAERLDQALPLTVREAEAGMLLENGVVLLAPGGHHMRIVNSALPQIALSQEPGAAPYQPSVDVLFHSAAEVFGESCIAVLLTGMGNDGADGMLHLARRGAPTIAQDEVTSMIFGMPRAAIALGAAREILPLPLIAARLRQIAGAGGAPLIRTFL
jgi:two-component system chemotaxis response regulator CheB